MTEDNRERSIDRRQFLKFGAVTGTSLAGVSSLPRVVNADNVSDTGGVEPQACMGPPASVGGIGTKCNGWEITFIKTEPLITPKKICEHATEGCVVYTVGSAADMVPGDEVVLGAACAVVGVSCEVRDEYSERHGNQKADLFRADGSGGSISNNDYLAVPSSWNW